jgi:uncharacterized protein YcfJ
MRVLKTALALSLLVVTAACDRKPEREPVDLSWIDTLDLRTPAAQQAVASPLELGMVHAAAPEAEPVAAAPVEEEVRPAKVASSSRKSTSSRSRTYRSGRSSGSSSGSYSGTVARREPRVVEVKNTKRDAAIGAVTGAAVGAVAGGSRHRVKGALIGAAAGGVAGAIIGSTIDKSKRVEY